ncbi:MAG: class C beta-lactamase-related serine hydrolase [Pedosphaera sp.]|nr:class C beta-lactamase-related serine hydrolase [Pedosphaera sp.]
MKQLTGFCLLAILVLTSSSRSAAASGSSALPRSTPEGQGISSAAILGFIEAADQKMDSLHSFMLVRHGKVVAEGWWSPYDARTPHEMYSLSKSFTSTAVGLAVAEGKLSIDDEVLKFFPADVPVEPSANLKAMRVRDLLTMSTGHQDETSPAPDKISAKSFLAHPVPHKPGTHFKYNTSATFMQSAIVQKVTGQTVLDYLRPRLFEPLGIENPMWAANSQGISLGGYGLSIRTEDIARFGQLYLQKGKWHGKQLIPAAWVEAATARQMSNGSNPASDWDQGYGFQFWRSRHGAYRGDGAFGQYCLVMPEQDAVIAITSGLKDMQAVLNLVWEKLLPAMQPRGLSQDRGTQKKLADKLVSLAIPLAKGSSTSPVAGRVSGRKFIFPSNDQKLDSLAIDAGSSASGATLTLRLDGRDQRIQCGQGEWKKGRLQFPGSPERVVTSSGAWTADDTFSAKLCFYETPYIVTLKLRFADGQVFYDREANVGFGTAKPTQLVGRAE